MNKELNKRKIKFSALLEVFAVSLKLGVTSFGGPIAHLGYFYNEYVERRKWLNERSYLDLTALCQFLPGPASSQLGIAIGTIRAGIAGGAAAWLGFTLPSALMLILFARVMQDYNFIESGWIHGLKIVAVAIVAHAVLTLWQKLIKDKVASVIALTVFVILLFFRSAFNQIIIIAAAGFIGFLFYRKVETPAFTDMKILVNKKTGALFLITFFLLLILFPLLREITGNKMISVADSFYRSGALVFGGGHVVLPLIEQEVVPPGWVSEDIFLAGYGAAQGIPGPLFTFSAYLGVMIDGMKGGLIALLSIFLPAFLLVIGILPFWNILRGSRQIQGVFTGINAAVVGLLLAALYNPLWVSAVFSKYDIALSVLLFGMVAFIKLPPWVIVIIGAAGGMIFQILKI